ncbi:unnamed protein product [Ostreobium quekettii]|uniref:Dynein intermediate chain n=1 Tax=Ostreobium quekettii TaxID=121088 RepID=A0A8S1INN0_9CHLO|nr:unnamed protein product [Ostreobium quekettii]|eukprot:evm.model.scf_48.9 EVM.evm.TU.scf_48.9   scf_48:47341-52430(+)
MLTATNPAAAKNIARFNMKERCYKFEPMVEQTMVHYATDGWLLHKANDEAKKQIDMEKLQEDALMKFQAEMDRAVSEKKDEGVETEPPDDSRQLRNQFNFSDRAAQTFNNPMRERATFTEPPPTSAMAGSVSQWEIYDQYIQDIERQKVQEEINKAKAAAKKGGAVPSQAPKPSAEEEDENKDTSNTIQGPEMSRAAHVLERMVNQNTFDELSMDFKYWDDATDALREAEGTLLPLWKFSNEMTRRRHVTSLCWNPRHLDMFAVGYGSYDFLKPSSGLICIYSMKNASYPEYTFTTDSGVLSVDFNPERDNLLAVGCYDGSVLVFDVSKKINKPVYQSTIKNGKRSDPVWQVSWQPDESSKLPQFYSVSSDGHVDLWTVTKAELMHEEVLSLRMVPRAGDGEAGGEARAGSLARGCCFDFSKANAFIYLVGTEEGRIHECSKAYSSEYLNTFDGHGMPIYSVKWNYIHTKMFLTASADWSVKLWNSTSPEKNVMAFDLGSPVGDVAWAPYSSTVFAAVTDEGKVHVYNLFRNKHEAMCEQKIIKKGRLTKLEFNPRHPIVIVGDDRGCVTCLKLSPNLRMTSQPEKGQNFEEMEVQKLDKVIEVALKSVVGGEGGEKI